MENWCGGRPPIFTGVFKATIVATGNRKFPFKEWHALEHLSEWV